MRKGTRGVRVGPSTVVALSLALLSMLAMAGSSSTSLPNGANLTVSIDDPVTSMEFEVPPGQATIDVDVSGTASVGLGEADATFVYVMDTSGSTSAGSGTGCSPVLACEKQFFVALNSAVAADGSTDEVGFVTFGGTSTIHDMSTAGGFQNFTTPSDPNVATVINSPSASGLTNCTAALNSALTLVNAASNSVKNVVFASDGLCNTGGSIAPAVTALAASGAVVNSIAVGTGSNCTSNGGTGTLGQMAVNGGQCFEVPDPGNLPNLIDNLIGSTLVSLDMSVDGGTAQTIQNADISLPLPQPGAVSVNYATPATGLGPGDHEICVTAHGSDVTGGTASTTRCETIHLLQLTAAPAEETNELGSDNEHTVTATILGPASHIGGHSVDFSVTGQNAGATGTCSPNADCTTDAGGQVSFTYSVPVAPSSLGTDTIHVHTEITEGGDTTIDLVKHWTDTTPPRPECVETVNPHGGNVPRAGQKSPGQNEDGFYQVTATDAVDPNPQIFVRDDGSGTLFGPFASGTRIKYTQAPGATPSIKKIGSGSGQAGAVDWHITGKGDALVFAVDGSGNVAPAVSCLVPPPPK